MSLDLNMGTKPDGLRVKTLGYGGPGVGDVIIIGDYELSLLDFLVTAHYVLTNTDLEQDDPRRQFVRCVSAMNEVHGWGRNNIPPNPEAVRFESPVDPVLL
ncbi:MAG TPA: hypothetical protein VJJ22_04985 [Candidatus Paceibacterota bacterium]